MKKLKERACALVRRKDGMELVQVAILVAIAIVIGLIFRTQIEKFVNEVFTSLSSDKFK
ncbi:MAG: hypothetical protein LBR14_03680 [Clostridiales Family XIII bacterium]|jgi:hypothetical protein|nr:hypothetical protein [Clostridiales Family XIII bacterium]